jgi:hypothetical protein
MYATLAPIWVGGKGVFGIAPLGPMRAFVRSAVHEHRWEEW